MKQYAGLQVYDANSKLVVDITDRLPRILGSYQTNKQDGSINIEAAGTIFYQVVRLTNAEADTPPRITLTNRLLSWKYGDAYKYRKDFIIVYGVY